MNRVALVLALCGPALPALAAGADCPASAPREARLAVTDVARVRVIARAGSLRITGKPGAAAIEARGLACANDQKLVEAIQLRAERIGSEARITVEVPDGGWTFGWSGTSPHLDLEVTLPANLPLEVEDSSGSIEIADTGALRLTDSSGEIRVQRVGGDVELRDSSGEAEIDDVRGSVRVIEDSSGELRISRVDGDVVVREDSSGGIDISAVKGSVRIDEDGSGPIRVRDVGGDFEVGRDGSGGISHEGVKGQVRLPERRR
ncbi:MAG: DUF4097 domain-containing protein [Vicinamibacteria bacterium]|nr:DUF4097 domain-containing protein [Vicinamibacteria bacterium]